MYTKATNSHCYFAQKRVSCEKHLMFNTQSVSNANPVSWDGPRSCKAVTVVMNNLHPFQKPLDCI